MNDKPPKATSLLEDDEGNPIYTCPHCGEAVTTAECDCLGADRGCVFCPHCNGEFET